MLLKVNQGLRLRFWLGRSYYRQFKDIPLVANIDLERIECFVSKKIFEPDLNRSVQVEFSGQRITSTMFPYLWNLVRLAIAASSMMSNSFSSQEKGHG